MIHQRQSRPVEGGGGSGDAVMCSKQFYRSAMADGLLATPGQSYDKSPLPARLRADADVTIAAGEQSILDESALVARGLVDPGSAPAPLV
jgi:hypothetical protein